MATPQPLTAEDGDVSVGMVTIIAPAPTLVGDAGLLIWVSYRRTTTVAVMFNEALAAADSGTPTIAVIAAISLKSPGSVIGASCAASAQTSPLQELFQLGQTEGLFRAACTATE